MFTVQIDNIITIKLMEFNDFIFVNEFVSDHIQESPVFVINEPDITRIDAIGLFNVILRPLRDGREKVTGTI
jgi:hypothetical protein